MGDHKGETYLGIKMYYDSSEGIWIGWLMTAHHASAIPICEASSGNVCALIPKLIKKLKNEKTSLAIKHDDIAYFLKKSGVSDGSD